MELTDEALRKTLAAYNDSWGLNMGFSKGFATAVIFASMAGSIGVGSAASASETITYTYNALGRLVVAKSTGTVNNNQTHSICYDAAGNRVLYDSNTTGTPPACVSSP